MSLENIKYRFVFIAMSTIVPVFMVFVVVQYHIIAVIATFQLSLSLIEKLSLPKRPKSLDLAYCV